jgi:glutamate formiminotransferase
VARTAVDVLDLTEHAGVHPRFGVLDVVPFVDLDPDGRRIASTSAVGARNRFAQWAGNDLDLPCFLYGPERPLPEIRRHAFTTLMPDFGPPAAHPTAGATAVGARGILIAYNLWLADSDLTTARSVAAALRGPSVRALGLRVGIATQVSCNLVNPDRIGPAEVYDFVASRVDVARAELVGLVPAEVLRGIPVGRWRELDLDPARTIEARLEEAGLDSERSGGG